MAYTSNKKIADLETITTVDDTDYVVVGDTSDSDRAKKITYANLQNDIEADLDLSAYVPKSAFDANTVLYATTDNTPVALTVGASTFVGRKSTGNISAMSATEARTELNVADGATANSKATGAELDTGTDDVKFATAKALKDSHNVPSVAPGTSGNVLTSNGTDWTSSAPSGGSWTTISSGTLGSASATLMDVSSISTSYDVFRITITWLNIAGSSRDIWLRFNNDSGGNYATESVNFASGTVSASRESGQTKIRLNIGQAVDLSSTNSFTLTVFKPTTGMIGNVIFEGKLKNTTAIVKISGSADWNNTADKITRIAITDEDGTGIFDTGSFYLLEGAIIA